VPSLQISRAREQGRLQSICAVAELAVVALPTEWTDDLIACTSSAGARIRLARHRAETIQDRNSGSRMFL